MNSPRKKEPVDRQAAGGTSRLTAWIAGASLLVLIVQIMYSVLSDGNRSGLIIKLATSVAMVIVLGLLRLGRARTARLLLPSAGLVAANTFLLTTDGLTPILFVTINASVIFLAGAILGHTGVLAFSIASALISLLLPLGQSAGWLQVATRPPHGWVAAGPMFTFFALFSYLAFRDRHKALAEAAVREAELDTLRQASSIVVASLDLDETIERILMQLRRVVSYDSASVQILGDGYLEIIAGHGWEDMDDIIGIRFAIAADNPNSIVIRTGHPYILNDAPNQHAQFRKPPHNHIRSWLGIPLRTGDRVTGMMSVDSSLPDMYGERDARLALAFADAVSIALENARHFEAEQRRRQLAAMQLDIIQVAGSTLELGALLEQIAAMTAEAAGARFSSIFLSPPGEAHLSLAAFHLSSQDNGATHEAMRSGLQELGSSSIVRRALDHHRATVLDREDAASALPVGWAKLGRVSELLLAPLYAPHGILGAIVLGAGNGKQTFDPDEIALIEMISHSLAASIENARLYSQTEQMAITDSLTGLYNRRGLFQIAEREVERSRRYQRPVSVLMVDLDHFKPLNDSYGHVVGDEVLASVAARLYQTVRRIDAVGRYGGEEFMVLLPECKLEFAAGVAERIRQVIESDPISSAVGPISVTVSVGVASSETSPLELEELIQRADDALYSAKEAGRNRVRSWEPDRSDPADPESR